MDAIRIKKGMEKEAAVVVVVVVVVAVHIINFTDTRLAPHPSLPLSLPHHLPLRI
jgi:hypothetical protein